jgi:ABC-2 type transport system ATP-binding protein
MASDMLLSARGVCKRYGRVTALDGVDVSVGKGSVLGIVGPNGAGKTTLVRILCGLMSADSGEVGIFGFDPVSEPVRAKRRLGLVLESGGLYDRMTVSEYLTFVGMIHGLEKRELGHRLNALLELFGMSSERDKLIEHCSKGNRRKAAIAASILHDPELLILDEPFEGLDPTYQKVLLDTMGQFCRSGAGILVTSHVLPELEKIATEITVLNRSRVVFSSPADGVALKFKQYASEEEHGLERLFHSLVPHERSSEGLYYVGRGERGG